MLTQNIKKQIYLLSAFLNDSFVTSTIQDKSVILWYSNLQDIAQIQHK